MMTADRFLDLLEQQGLLDPQLLARLRHQVAQASSSISAPRLAKLLVDKGQLSAADARRTLDTPVPSPGTKWATELGAASTLPKNSRPYREQASSPKSLFDEEFVVPALDNLASDSLFGDPSLLESSPLNKPRSGLKRLWGGRSSTRQGKNITSNSWDSPLILIGGGTLALLLIGGTVLLWVLYRDSGDQQFQLAEDDYLAGSYTQAIAKYGEFASAFPNHAQASRARVNQGLARIRQTISTKQDYAGTLAITQQVLPEIESEAAFSEAREQLRSILPDLAEGLARETQASSTADQKKQGLAKIDEALALVGDTRYLLPSHRPTNRLQIIEEIKASVMRDLEGDTALRQTLTAMDQATTSGNLAAAYLPRKQLLKKYPELERDQALEQAIRRVSAAEQAAIRVTDEAVQASASEPTDAPVTPRWILAERRTFFQPPAKPAESVPGRAAVVHARGALYGLDAQTGQLLWRRGVGSNLTPQPTILVDDSATSDGLVIDRLQKALVRLNTRSGQLVWRFPVQEEFSPPARLGDQLFVAARSGKLWSLDLVSGNSQRQVLLNQGLRVSPAINPRKSELYLVGEHSNLYVLSADSLKCQQVVYLGHETGTVQVPPVLANQYLIVAENWGATDSKLHVLAANSENQTLEVAQEIRLTGHVLTSPVVFGRRMVVATDRAQIVVFEIGQAGNGKPLTAVAERVAESGKPQVRYLAIKNEKLWVADSQLSCFAIQLSSGRLVPQAIDNPETSDSFIGPLQIVGESLIQVRQRTGRPGVTVAATNLAAGKRTWETDVAVPPAGPPIPVATRQQIAWVSATGALFTLDVANSKAPPPQAYDAPVTPDGPTAKTTFTTRVELRPGQYVFAPPAGSSRLLTFDSAKSQLQWIQLPASLSCAPVALAGNLLAPLSTGQIALVDLQGASQGVSFQPRLTPNMQLAWLTPGVTDDGTQALVADNESRLFRIGRQKKPAPHLAALASSEGLPARLTSALAMLGQTAYSMDEHGALQAFDCATLTLGKQLNLGSQAVWGPERCGNLLLLVNEQEELLAISASGEIAWKTPLPFGPLAGPPLVDNGSYLFASTNGVLWRVAADTGREIARVDTGQSLATGPVSYGDQVLLAGEEGILLMLSPPAPKVD